MDRNKISALCSEASGSIYRHLFFWGDGRAIDQRVRRGHDRVPRSRWEILQCRIWILHGKSGEHPHLAGEDQKRMPAEVAKQQSERSYLLWSLSVWGQPNIRQRYEIVLWQLQWKPGKDVKFNQMQRHLSRWHRVLVTDSSDSMLFKMRLIDRETRGRQLRASWQK